MLKIVKSFLTIVAVAAIATGATGAYFNDSETVPGNTFQAGTLDLNLDPATPGNATPIVLSGIKPGDGVANENAFYKRWNLVNSGSLNVKYRVRAIVDPSQRNALYDELRLKMGEYSSGPSKNLGTTITLAQLESGIVVDTNVIPTASDTRNRTVWTRWYLPTSVGNSVQGLSVNFSIVFEAIQTNDMTW